MIDRLIKTMTGCIVSAVLIGILPIYASDSVLFEQKHTEKEIRGIVALVQQELDNRKKTKAVEIADKEIMFIEMSLVKAKNLLEQKQLDDAYYQIEITRALFEIIDARLELYYSKQILEQLKARKAADQ